MGAFMHAFFFRQFFAVAGIKALQKFTEADDVDQFVRDDIKAKWKKRYIRHFFQRGMNRMVLKAYFIVVEGT